MKKASTKYSVLLLLLYFFFTGSHFSYAQDAKKDKAANAKKLIESRHYEFVAQSANPTTGRFRQLTSDYDLRLSGDTMVVYLPYYGRSYIAPIDPSKNPLDFTSTRFDYTARAGKKGGWDITIIPKDNNEVRQLMLSVSYDGYAMLQVLSNNLQPISFNGYIRNYKKKG
jgi:hypothetical protein